jgi:hypothetical protein
MMPELQEPRPVSATPPERPLDSRTVEMLALTAFRTIFREGIHVPLKLNGVSDMDLLVRDSDVTLNLNQLQLQVPSLVIWRITVAFQGKPLVEYGRGVKNDMKLHLGQLFFLLLVMWREKRRSRRTQLREDGVRRAEALARTSGGAHLAEAEVTTA